MLQGGKLAHPGACNEQQQGRKPRLASFGVRPFSEKRHVARIQATRETVRYTDANLDRSERIDRQCSAADHPPEHRPETGKPSLDRRRCQSSCARQVGGILDEVPARHARYFDAAKPPHEFRNVLRVGVQGVAGQPALEITMRQESSARLVYRHRHAPLV